MPSFTFLNDLEFYFRTGKFPENSTKRSRHVTRTATKTYLYKGGTLWRRYRGRLLRVVRSDEEIREVLMRYHENNNHAGRVRMVKEIMLMYYWVGVTEAVKKWVHACDLCRAAAATAAPPARQIRYCLVYGCEASSFLTPDLGFHRFPKAAEVRRRWLALAQRDEGSLRTNSYVCSRHFESSCFTPNEDGQPKLSKDAVPTVLPPAVREEEEGEEEEEEEEALPVPSDEDFMQSTTLDDLLSSAAAATTATVDPSDLSLDPPETPAGLQEHQYSLPDSEEVQDVSVKRRKTMIEPSFTVYNHITRYLSHRVLPFQNKNRNASFRRMAKRFGLIDGILMYTRVTPPVRVPRSRDEVNSILQQFHNNQGHYGQGLCQREISKHFYWCSLTRDLARWISSCHACLTRTKRKWLRCSMSNCTNCCGPVERGLGLTFHKFPQHSTALLAQWLQAVGRAHWHPRLRSSVCSTHFTPDCFDRSGDKVALRPDAVPTLLIHGEAAVKPIQPAAGDEVFFAKYDAVELYLSKQKYPPGLNYVEKNTFRRFCKKYAMKDGELQMVRGERVRLVLRSRPQVEAALTDYHDELNHLDANKCLRLLNERYFWKTMRSDVVQWISNCSHCSRRKGKKPERRGGEPETLRTPRRDSDSQEEDEGLDDEGSEGGGGDGGGEQRPDVYTVESVSHVSQQRDGAGRKDEVEVRGPAPPPDPDGLMGGPVSPGLRRSRVRPPSSQTASSVTPQPRIPILLRLRAPVPLQVQTRSSTRAPGSWSDGTAPPPQTHSHLQTQVEPVPPASQVETRSCEGGALGGQDVLTEPQTKPASPNGVLKGAAAAAGGGEEPPAKRRRGTEARNASSGLEPVVAPSTKPWPVFTIGCSTRATPAEAAAANGPAVVRGSRSPLARVVLQLCSSARVKTRPELDGAEAQWAEIQDGMVVYVGFFQAANEVVAYDMAASLMSAKLFRKDARHKVSLLDRPGSLLLVPQDSLGGEPRAGRRHAASGRPRGGCELWWGAQLFATLVTACRELVASSARCTNAGVKVEHGVYGQKQELAVTSDDPMTLLLEF